jgi:hypothetical protein
LVKSFQQLLFDNRIEEFEDRLTQHFFKQSSQNFGLNFCYTDWLAKFSRKVGSKPKIHPGLVIDYLANSNFESFGKKDYLFRFFQFLTFLRRVKGSNSTMVIKSIILSLFPSLIFYSLQVSQVSQEKGSTN